MKTRITKLSVAPEGADLYDDLSTHIKIDDEGGGEYVRISQQAGSAEIKIDAVEWPYIREAINSMIEGCKK